MELSPGDCSRRHWGDGRLPPPHAASLPALRLLRRGRFLGGLGIRLRVLRGLLLPGAEGHGLDAERQDADAARVDLPGLARLILVVRPGFALAAAGPPPAPARLIEVLPVQIERAYGGERDCESVWV